MKNKYKVEGDRILIEMYSNKTGVTCSIINKEDFDIVNSLNGTWFPKTGKEKASKPYAVCNRRLSSGKRETVRMHRVILDAGKGDVVDHINHDTLDNTRNNLRIVSSRVNQYNREKANTNSITGVLGVHFRKDIGKFRARVFEGGKAVYSKHFNTLGEAKASISKERMRLHYLPQVQAEEVTDIDETERGDGGFGSTGIREDEQ